VDTAPVDVAPLDAAIVRPGPAPVLAETPPVFAAEPAHPVLQAPPRNDVAAALLAPPPAFPPAEETPTLPASTDAVPLPRPAPPGAAAKPVAQARRPERPAKPSKPAAAAKKPVSSATEAAPRKSAKAKAAPALRSATQPKGKAAAKPAMAGGAQGGGGSGARAAAGPGVEAAYAKKLFSHLARRQRYPAAAERARVTGTVRLSIAIDRSGGLAAARVAKGSGHAVLDAEALATARRASPYPKPPEGVGGKTYGFAVTLRFDRKR
jgi:protein TonB